MTALPPIYYLHVWWARRPLVASRAAVLASLLPADVDRQQFLHVIGIHGDPVAARQSVDGARRVGIRVVNPYDYARAFSYAPTLDDKKWLAELSRATAGDTAVLDPTAGGGSIPFESARLGLASSANDLNPVAVLVMRATVEWPVTFSEGVKEAFEQVAWRWRRLVESRLDGWFVQAGLPDRIDATYLWARTVACPYCDGLVPLSPNWRVAPDGTGIRLEPRLGDGPGTVGRVCSFEIVTSTGQQSAGTVARGNGICPYTDCGRVIDGDEIKRQAQAGRMGDQLYAVVYKERVRTKTKTGKIREKWIRRYRAPRTEDDNAAGIKARLAEKLPEWEAFDIVPTERFPADSNDDRPIQYGMPLWRDLFSPRQLLGHGVSVEVFREMLDAEQAAGALDACRKAAYGYLALSLDKLRDYNSRMTRWHAGREVVAGTFDRHDFSFKWSYAEMAPLITGLGYDWAIQQTAKCIGELVALVRPESVDGARGLLEAAETRIPNDPPPVTITCKSGDNLDHIENGSVDAVVMDPPYYDNVMYAELSDLGAALFHRLLSRSFIRVYVRGHSLFSAF